MILQSAENSYQQNWFGSNMKSRFRPMPKIVDQITYQLKFTNSQSINEKRSNDVVPLGSDHFCQIWTSGYQVFRFYQIKKNN